MWDPSLTTQCQLADSIKPQTLGLKSTTLTTGPHEETNVLKHYSNLIYIYIWKYMFPYSTETELVKHPVSFEKETG